MGSLLKMLNEYCSIIFSTTYERKIEHKFHSFDLKSADTQISILIETITSHFLVSNSLLAGLRPGTHRDGNMSCLWFQWQLELGFVNR